MKNTRHLLGALGVVSILSACSPNVDKLQQTVQNRADALTTMSKSESAFQVVPGCPTLFMNKTPITSLKNPIEIISIPPVTTDDSVITWKPTSTFVHELGRYNPWTNSLATAQYNFKIDKHHSKPDPILGYEDFTRVINIPCEPNISHIVK